jgi:hypothetical protein
MSLMDDMTYPFGISELLDERQRAALEDTQVSLGHGRTSTVASLIVGWAGHVNRLHAERDLGPGQDSDAWTPHDYVAALLIRERVQDALDQLGPELRQAASRAVAVFDELLNSFTEPDDRQVLRRFSTVEPGEQWWWRRIPASGPVRTDLDRYAERTAQS